MKVYTVDLAEVRSPEQLHTAFEQALFMEDYGKNLDSLRQALADRDEELHIALTHTEEAETALHGYLYALGMMLEDLHEEFPQVTYELVPTPPSELNIFYSED